MPTPDEPLPAEPAVEIEEISTEFIIQDEPVAPRPDDDPFVAASRALVAEPAPVAQAASRAAVRAARAAPARPPAEPPSAKLTAPVPAEPPEPAVRRQGLSLVAALAFLGVGAAGGFFTGVLWERQGAGSKPQPATAVTLPPPAATQEESPPAPEEPRRSAPKVAKPARKPPSPAAARAPVVKGRLKLTAPAEAVVYLDGRRIGKGSMNVDVPVGVHRIEVRLGKAKVAERFWIEPNETWTYDVTPDK